MVQEWTNNKSVPSPFSVPSFSSPQTKITQPENSLYLKSKKEMKREIQQLVVALQAAESRQKERIWLKNQQFGELDESKLVDGVVGDVNIWKKRGIPEKEVGGIPTLPKRVVIAVDVSASMSRGNLWDGRLDRCVESVVMLVEALDKFPHKFSYSIYGHSGSGVTELLGFNKGSTRSPEEKEHLVSEIVAISDSSVTGDSSLLAMEVGVKVALQEEADDYLVLLVSDAHLGRYSISPSSISAAVSSDPRVCSCIFFIAEPNAAHSIVKKIGSDKVFVCLKPSSLPSQLKSILLSRTANE